jgi:multidrug efflux system membrane fusion protein
MKWRTTPFGLARLVIAASVAACTSQAAPMGAPPPPSVVAVPVVSRDVEPWDEFTGRVAAVDSVDIRPRVSGYVTGVRYREGSDVKVGQVLFTIDGRPYQAALARANAELARARARATQTRDDAARAERLVATSAIPRAERDTAASLAAQAEADVQAALAAVDLAKLDVDFTQVRSPIAGRAGQALVTLGNYVAAGPSPTPLTSVMSVDPVYIYFTGDEQAFLRFGAKANEARALIGLSDEQGYPHQAKIDFIDNRLDPTTGTIRVRAVLDNPDRKFTPGLYARVRINTDAAVHALLVDDKAILTDQDRRFVYALDKGDVVARRDVKLGRVVDGLRVVQDGLKPDDRVIVRGMQKVMPGIKVTVEAPPPPAQQAAPKAGAPT